MTPAPALLLLTLLLGQAPSPPELERSEIPLRGDFLGVWTAQLDGDGATDLLIATHERGRERELRVHRQRNGRFGAAPDRIIPVKQDIIAFAIADVREEPGAELLLFTRSSCFSYSTALDGYRGNARRLLSWNLICDMPSAQRLPFLDCALDPQRLVLPGATGFGVFARKGSGDFGLERSFDVAALTRGRNGDGNPDRFSVRMRLGVESSPGTRRVLLPAAERDGENSTLLSTSRWLPAPVLADHDGDGRRDLAFLDASTLQLWSGGDAPLRVTGLPVGAPLRLVDLDDDGDLDLLRSESDRDSHKLSFYLRGPDGFDPETPDGVIKYSGFGLQTTVADLDGDGRSELAATAVAIGRDSALLGVEVERKLLIHAHDPDSVFSRRPTTRFVRTYNARNIEGIERLQLDGRLSTSRGRDVIALEQDGAVTARSIGGDLNVAEQPFWTHRSGGVRELRLLHLGDDDRSDLLLIHRDHLEILVGRP